MSAESQYRYATVGRSPEFTDIIGVAALPEFAPSAILPAGWPERSLSYAEDVRWNLGNRAAADFREYIRHASR